MSTQQESGVVIRRESGLPAYRQLVDQFRYLIGAGRYPAGQYLPTMRSVADELGLNLNTVNRAYRQLQRDGLIRSTPGKGARVVAHASRSTSRDATPIADPAALERVDAILAAAIERALSAGMAPGAIGGRVEEIVAAFTRRVPPPPRLAVASGFDWRDRALAARLASATGREVVAVADADAGPLSLLVRPRYGAWTPSVDVSGRQVPVVELALVADRDAIRRLVLAEAGARVCVVAGDESVAQWLAETATMLGPSSVRRAVTADASTVVRAPGELYVVEDGLPGLSASDDVFVVPAAFTATAASEVDGALGR